VRHCGLPTVLERLLPQAVRPGLPPAWAQPCAAHREGVRPERAAHQAVARAPPSREAGEAWGVDRERDQGVDRGHPEKWRRLVKGRSAARRGWQRLARSRKAGVLTGDGVAAPGEGTPPGGPLSPLGAPLRLEGFAKEWARRGHRVVRDAAERHLSGKSPRAGQRGLARGRRFVERRVPLPGNAVKRAGDRPWRRPSLGGTCTRRRPHRRQGSAKALQARTPEGRQRPCRTRGVALQRVVDGLRQSLDGWDASVRVPEGPSGCKERDAWVRRRLRCAVWQPWGPRRSRALRPRGVRCALAWQTGQSAHGPWRLRRSPAVMHATAPPET
jgi:RNA-directed DNA polymerase